MSRAEGRGRAVPAEGDGSRPLAAEPGTGDARLNRPTDGPLPQPFRPEQLSRQPAACGRRPSPRRRADEGPNDIPNAKSSRSVADGRARVSLVDRKWGSWLSRCTSAPSSSPQPLNPTPTAAGPRRPGRCPWRSCWPRWQRGFRLRHQQSVPRRPQDRPPRHRQRSPAAGRRR